MNQPKDLHKYYVTKVNPISTFGGRKFLLCNDPRLFQDLERMRNIVCCDYDHNPKWLKDLQWTWKMADTQDDIWDVEAWLIKK